VIEHSPGAEMRWEPSGEITQRTLASLARDGALSSELGLLKIDTEGADGDVLAGAAGLRAEIVMVEYWDDLPGSLGRCPYDLEDVAALAQTMGAARFVWFRHGPLSTTVEWDVADPSPGEWGNLVFLADHLIDSAQMVIENLRRDLHRSLEARAFELNAAAAERGELVEELGNALRRERAAAERHRAAANRDQRAAERDRAVAERDRAVAERDRAVAERDHAALEASLQALAKREAELAARLDAAELTTRARRLRRRAEERTTPRLGVLWQTAPEPLRVPAAYWRERPPSPSPRISIVTPSFHSSRYLGRTLRSVLDQDYPALEYVVQDGGSDDGTVALLERHSNGLTHWASEPDRGQAHALNLGFNHTSGEIMAFLNADDMLLPGALAHVASHFDRHPETDVVYGQRVIIDDNGHRVGLWITPPHCDGALLPADWVPQETLFWRRRAWEAAGGHFDEQLHFALDWDLLLRLRAAKAKIVRLPRLIAAFRVHPKQKTQALAARGEEECRALRARHIGRALSHEDATFGARAYLRRHVAYHIAFRARERLPRRRLEVPAGPLS
jgi:GT2 family glycosyltransferase